MKNTFILFLFLFVLSAGRLTAQSQGDNPNLDQIPWYLRERAAAVVNDAPLSTVVTIDNWDNYSLGVDFAENNMAEKPGQPTWYFTAYNTNAPHHTENGIDWFNNTANFGTSVQGDPVVAYDSIGNLFYENMYGNITGCKVLVSTNNGVSWSSPVTAISGNDKNWIACDQTAGPYANYAYSTMTNNGVGSFSRTTDHGVTWNSTFAPTTQSLPGMMVCVGPEGNIQGGAVYVVTNSGQGNASVYTFYRSNDGGATFILRSTQQFSNYVGSYVSQRNSVSNMRTRPYPMIAADNSYGLHRGNLYCVYASNFPSGNGNKSDVWCRTSTDGGATFGAAVRINDDPNTQNFQQWHPAIWCDKETGKLYAMWMDTRDCPTNDSALIYASYSTDGGTTWAPNQQISNKKMKIDCASCGGGGTPRYEGDYNGVVSNKKGSMIGWTDFRSGTFQSMTAYFPDFAMALDHSADTLYTASDNTTFQVSIPGVKLYTDTVILSAEISPAPTGGTITFEFPQGNTITSYPSAKPVKLILSGNIPLGTYQANFYAKGPNGTPAHKRTASIKVLQGNTFAIAATATPGAICQGQTSQLACNVVGGTPPMTYVWTPAATLSDPAIANPVATPAETTTYQVVVTDNTGITASNNVTVTVNTSPPAPGPITGLQSVCSGATADYSIVEVSGSTTYSWSVQGDAVIVSGQNTPNVTVQWGSQSGSIQVIAGNDCGNNPIASVLPVTVNQPPAGMNPITGPDLVCNGGAVKFYTSNNNPAVTYTWTVPEGVTIVNGQGTDTLRVTWGSANGIVSVSAQNTCGVSDTVTKSLTTTTIPDPAGAITGPDTVCINAGNKIYGIPAISGATTYIWTLPAGVNITAGSGTNQVTCTFTATAQSGTISVKGKNDCGEGTGSDLGVTVKDCTGIGEQGLQSSVRLFPNPVGDELTLEIRGRERQLFLTFTGATGQVVFSENLTGLPASYTKKLDMSRFPAGIYLFRLSNGERTFTEKVVVK
ncbi:MAG TPA: T9SS type A sorting domain-containing protein [Bacteroidales bacterium]|nr:T9SS type A sorting domain-containing protein [Bacteroidales bacterium]HPS62461.1 T9SS type A sorting domain-containing protein [Bacteroidales bacterium]